MSYKIYALKLGEGDRESARFVPGLVDSPAMRLYYYMWVLKNEAGEAVLGGHGHLGRGRPAPKSDEPGGAPRRSGGGGRGPRRGVPRGPEPPPLGPLLRPGALLQGHLLRPAPGGGVLDGGPYFASDSSRSRRGGCRSWWSWPTEVGSATWTGTPRSFLGWRRCSWGGHTPGTQAVVVQTAGGKAVLCADALDFYLNLEHDVIGSAQDLPRALLALDLMRGRASSSEMVIPGHDPAIMERYRSVAPGVAEVA